MALWLQCFQLPEPAQYQFVLAFLDIPRDAYTFSIGMLWVINAGFQVLTYLCLTLRLRRTVSSST